MGVNVGDRVKFSPSDKSTAKTQGQEVLLRGQTGTVKSLMGSEAAVVEWDAGTYEVYGDIVSGPSGLEAISSGNVELESFEQAVHTDYIQEPAGSE
jgi:hypothetical protein